MWESFINLTATLFHLDSTMKHFLALVKERGVDCWWELSEQELLPPELQSEAHLYCKGYDTMDVWLDSGSSWRAVVQTREQCDSRADVYLEGTLDI